MSSSFNQGMAQRFEREEVERSRSSVGQRRELAHRLLREVQVATDYAEQRLPGRWNAQIIHAACDEHRRTEYHFEQAQPILKSLIDEGFVEDKKDLRGLLLSEDGDDLLHNFDERSADPDLQCRLPWLAEGWQS